MITPNLEIFYNDYTQFQLKSPFSSLIVHLNSVSLFFYNYKISFLWDVREINIPFVGNLTKIPTYKLQNRPKENTRQRKKSHAQDNIYVVRQFAYVYGVAGISLLSGKIQ